MEKYFLQKFKGKTKIELQQIVDNKSQFQAAAVTAAMILLNENSAEFIELQKNNPQHTEVAAPNSDTIFNSFNHHLFIRTLSYREFLTTFTTAFLFCALSAIILYYSDEYYFENSYKTWLIFFLFMALLVNHFYYRIEHRRSNNFIGRCLIDIIFSISLILIISMQQVILNSNFRFTFNIFWVELLFQIIGLIVLIVVFEFCVAFLKFLLKYIRCQIF